MKCEKLLTNLDAAPVHKGVYNFYVKGKKVAKPKDAKDVSPQEESSQLQGGLRQGNRP